jgi:hypothetical protein
MKCILDKCPLYFESDNRGCCDIMFYCNKEIDCPIEHRISDLVNKLYELNKLKHHIDEERNKLSDETEVKNKETKKKLWYENRRDYDLENIRYNRD